MFNGLSLMVMFIIYKYYELIKSLCSLVQDTLGEYKLLTKHGLKKSVGLSPRTIGRPLSTVDLISVGS